MASSISALRRPCGPTIASAIASGEGRRLRGHWGSNRVVGASEIGLARRAQLVGKGPNRSVGLGLATLPPHAGFLEEMGKKGSRGALRGPAQKRRVPGPHNSLLPSPRSSGGLQGVVGERVLFAAIMGSNRM